MSDSESFEDEGDHGILKKALDVELPEDFDPSKVPQSGEEYLHHVIYERQHCKTWVTAEVDRTKFKHKQTLKIEPSDATIREAHPALIPTTPWKLSRIEDFTNFRKFIQFKIEETNSQASVSSFEEQNFLEKATGTFPQFSDIVSHSQSAKIRMLQIISKHLDNRDSLIGKELGAWLYAILVLLEKPLSPSSCHTLREFAKKCLNIRAHLPEDASSDKYTPLNLFITIVAKFYDQLDLADQ